MPDVRIAKHSVDGLTEQICSRIALCYYLISIQKSNGFRTFSYAAPFPWNHLLNTVRSASTNMSFRRSLKTYLFNQAFPTYRLSSLKEIITVKNVSIFHLFFQYYHLLTNNIFENNVNYYNK